MKTMRKCPNCQMKTLKQIAEGLGGRTWYVDYKCDKCDHFENQPCSTCKPDPLWATEYSVSSMKSTPIGINVKNWPDND